MNFITDVSKDQLIANLAPFLIWDFGMGNVFHINCEIFETTSGISFLQLLGVKKQHKFCWGMLIIVFYIGEI